MLAPQALWLIAARRDIGRRETLGPNDSPWLRTMLASLPGGGRWLFGQPWCGGAVANWLTQSGVPIPSAWYRARAWLDWGVTITYPARGAVAVFARAGGGHVGLVESLTPDGRPRIIGGNQRDSVRIDPFETDRLLGYRWPADHLASMPVSRAPVVAAAGTSSTNEA